MIAIRYVPAHRAHRLGYEPSAELAARLTPERLAIVQPIRPRRRPRCVTSTPDELFGVQVGQLFEDFWGQLQLLDVVHQLGVVDVTGE